jgi:hypothetical protein
MTAPENKNNHTPQKKTTTKKPKKSIDLKYSAL